MISPFASGDARGFFNYCMCEREFRKKFLDAFIRKEAAVVEKKGRHISCETCGNYVYDDDYGYYVCEASLDEDEMAAFLGNRRFECPYYVTDDEYRIVRKQM